MQAFFKGRFVYILWKCHPCGKAFDFPTRVWITAPQLPTFPQDLLLLMFYTKTQNYTTLQQSLALKVFAYVS